MLFIIDVSQFLDVMSFGRVCWIEVEDKFSYWDNNISYRAVLHCIAWYGMVWYGIWYVTVISFLGCRVNSSLQYLQWPPGNKGRLLVEMLLIMDPSFNVFRRLNS